MSRWIDAEFVIAYPIRINHYDEEHGNLDFVLGIETVMEYLEYAPTIDIVRCKECKFSEVWESTAGNELYCEKQRVCPYDWGALTAFYVKPDDFCSYGERRE